MNYEKKELNYWFILIISILFGWLGVDRFLMGDVKLGLIKLCTFGFCGVWWIIDIILVAVKADTSIEFTTSESSKKIGLGIISILIVFTVVSLCMQGKTDTNTKEVKEVVKTDDKSVVDDVTPTPTKTPVPTPTPVSTPTEKPTPEVTEEPFKYDSSITYNQLARNPDKYNLKGVVFTGKIIQIMYGDDGIEDYRIAINSNRDTLIYCSYKPLSGEDRLLENDIIRFNAIYTGLISYETVLGVTVTIPSAAITEIIKRP